VAQGGTPLAAKLITIPGRAKGTFLYNQNQNLITEKRKPLAFNGTILGINAITYDMIGYSPKNIPAQCVHRNH
jgi:hypothetical protein